MVLVADEEERLHGEDTTEAQGSWLLNDRKGIWEHVISLLVAGSLHLSTDYTENGSSSDLGMKGPFNSRADVPSLNSHMLLLSVSCSSQFGSPAGFGSAFSLASIYHSTVKASQVSSGKQERILYHLNCCLTKACVWDLMTTACAWDLMTIVLSSPSHYNTNSGSCDLERYRAFPHQ